MHGRFRRLQCLATALLAVAAVFFRVARPAEAADGEPSSTDNRAQKTEPKRNPVMKTLGGRQFWGDVLFFRGWRIQKNTLTGHFRLLDADDYRHASGTRRECEAMLEEIKQAQKLAPMTGKAVILVHGVIRSSKSFGKLRERLQKEGYTVVGFDYPSTQVGIEDSAGFLDGVVKSLDGIEQIDFVVHSMGGIVARTYLSKHRDKRIKRMVMMGVPNRGARMADRLRENALFRLVYGPAGQQLGSDPDGFIAKLPAPEIEFAIIAGGRDNISGYNPLVPGDDDGTVSVTSARLPGAADFLLVHSLHSFLMGDDAVLQATTRFLRTGRLREEGDPHPIPLPRADDAE